MEACAPIYRLKAAGRDGRPVVVGVSETASQALIRVRDLLGEYPRGWVTDEFDIDISLPELMRRAEEERDQDV